MPSERRQLQWKRREMKAQQQRPAQTPRWILVTCEHGGYSVPPSYRHLFKDAGDVLKTHRGWDPGALKLAQRFAQELNAPIFSATVTRLLVELNRSLNHPRLFSEFTKPLSRDFKTELLTKFWHPYRQSVEQAIADRIRDGHSVLHLSVHSFTPIWDGMPRATDVGLLYDPARTLEREFCCRWRTALKSFDSDLTIHRNAPYRGTDDGFVTALRRQFQGSLYAGIELEVNQKFFNANQRCRSDLAASLISSFQQSADLPSIHKLP